VEYSVEVSGAERYIPNQEESCPEQPQKGGKRQHNGIAFALRSAKVDKSHQNGENTRWRQTGSGVPRGLQNR